MKVFLLLLLISCSSTHLKRTVNESAQDGFKKESLFRYSESRLISLKKTHNLITQSLIMCHRGSIKEGLKKLNQNLDSYRENPSYWSAMGNCLYLDGNFEKAEYFYKLALSKNQNHIPSLNNLALIYLSRDQVSMALEKMQKAIKISNSHLLKYNYAQILIDNHRYHKAQKVLKKLYLRFPKDQDVACSYAISLFLNSLHEKSYQVFKSLDQDIRTRVDNHLYVAMNLLALDKFQETKNFLESVKTPVVKDLRISKEKLYSLVLKRIDTLDEVHNEK